MQRVLVFFLLPLFLFSKEIEVALNTKTPLPGIYISDFSEEMKSVLEFDLRVGGHASILAKNESIEKALTLQPPHIFTSIFKKEKIPFAVVCTIKNGEFEATLFQMLEGKIKKYSNISLTRRGMHQLADAIHKDLFGKMGIASLKLIYTERVKAPSESNLARISHAFSREGVPDRTDSPRECEKCGLGFLSEIWVSDYDGEGPKQITKEYSYCLSPHFLPNSASSFYYASEKSGQTKIYLSSIEEKKKELLINLRGNQLLPTISKDGAHIAFISDAAGRPDLFVQKLNKNGKTIGKPIQLFSAPRATQASPTFSPTGDRLAFVSDKDGPPRIYVIDLKKGNKNLPPIPRLLTRKNRENTSPAWSLDGTKLAYSAKEEGVRQIWIYDFNQQEEYPLTQGPKNKENPSWAPDSFHLVYNTEENDESELYLIDLNRAIATLIGKSSKQKRFASFQPFPSH